MSNGSRKVAVVCRCSRAGLLLALVTVTSPGLFGAGCSGPGKDAPAGVPTVSPPTPDDLSRATAVRHMTQHAAAHLLPANPNLKVTALRRDRLRQSHVRLQQLVGDVPVLGGEMIVHLDDNQQVLSVTDAVVPGMMAAPPVAAISEQDAVDAALAALGCSDC